MKESPFMMSSYIARKIRNLQAKKIKESQQSVRFPEIVNEVIEKGLE